MIVGQFGSCFYGFGLVDVFQGYVDVVVGCVGVWVYYVGFVDQLFGLGVVYVWQVDVKFDFNVEFIWNFVDIDYFFNGCVVWYVQFVLVGDKFYGVDEVGGVICSEQLFRVGVFFVCIVQFLWCGQFDVQYVVGRNGMVVLIVSGFG